MFGDLALFKDRTFFRKNRTATLMIPGENRTFYTAAILQTSAGTEEIFNPDRWKDNLDGLGKFLQKNSKWYHSGYLQALIEHPEKMEVTALVTCSDGSTNDRTVLILIRTKDNQSVDEQDDKVKDDKIIGNGLKNTGNTQNPQFWMWVIIGILLFIVVFESVDRLRERKNRE